MNNDDGQWFDIPSAAMELDLSPTYVRLMVRNGVIATKKVPVREGSNVTKHMIHKSELYAFSQREGAKAPRRKDGRNKHCFYAYDDEVRIIKELLYSTHDDRLRIVAESIQDKETLNERYIPPSKQQPRLAGGPGGESEDSE